MNCDSEIFSTAAEKAVLELTALSTSSLHFLSNNIPPCSTNLGSNPKTDKKGSTNVEFFSTKVFAENLSDDDSPGVYNRLEKRFGNSLNSL